MLALLIVFVPDNLSQLAFGEGGLFFPTFHQHIGPQNSAITSISLLLDHSFKRGRINAFISVHY
jgi:hypothetical protein